MYVLLSVNNGIIVIFLKYIIGFLLLVEQIIKKIINLTM